MSVPHRLRHVMCLEDLESLGRSFLPKALWEFISIGVEDNVSREGNRRAFDDYWLKPRVLNDVTARTTSRSLFDKTYDAPFGIAPMGASAMFGFEADLNFARAAKKANIPYVMSGSALISMEKVAAANPDVWFQAYVETSRDLMAALADRAWNAGIRNLVITVDVPVGGNRAGNLRAGFTYPIKPNLRVLFDGATHPRWLFETFFRTLMSTGIPHMENTGAGRGISMISMGTPERKHARDGLDWDDLKWLRDHWKGRLLIKGVLSSEDAKVASKVGLDGLFVSNHGGRQLDTAIPPLKVLAEIAAEKGDMAILFDGGIRRGSDVIKALALGADFIFVGRPMLFAAGLALEPGVAHAINLLQDEIHRNLALLGSNDLSDLVSRVVRNLD
jgi:L-lactate dehydrogenase (cytochrome)